MEGEGVAEHAAELGFVFVWFDFTVSVEDRCLVGIVEHRGVSCGEGWFLLGDGLVEKDGSVFLFSVGDGGCIVCVGEEDVK